MHTPLNTALMTFTDQFLQPSQRMFWGYLVTSLLILTWAYCRTRSPKYQAQLRQGFQAKHWFNRSSLVDAQWFICNLFLRTVFIVPLIGSQLGFALWINQQFFTSFGEGNFIHSPVGLSALLFTVTIFIADDLSRFLVHAAYHRWSFLWRFHAIHHSATSLTPLTLHRVHSIEMLINSLRSVCVLGTVSGLFMYCFAGQIKLLDIVGVNIFIACFNLAGANLRHSPFWIGFGRWEKLFISPAQHQLHHSADAKHYNQNFGSALAFWDRCLRTWTASNNQHVNRFGLNASADNNHHHGKYFWRQILGIRIP